MSKHTPGPWVITNDGYIIPEPMGPTDCAICEMILGANRDSNARLITSAPDLLDACKTALKVVSEIADINSECRAGWAHKQLVEAIANAEGK